MSIAILTLLSIAVISNLLVLISIFLNSIIKKKRSIKFKEAQKQYNEQWSDLIQKISEQENLINQIPKDNTIALFKAIQKLDQLKKEQQDLEILNDNLGE